MINSKCEVIKMANNQHKYKLFERFLTVALCTDAIAFIFYMIFAGLGIVWLKVILTLVCFALSGYILWLLYNAKELLRQRSLWITVGAGAIAFCLFMSLVLNFPSPNKYKQVKEEISTNQEK